MRATIVSVCDKLPGWVKQGFDDYAERLRRDLPLQCIDISLGKRSPNSDVRKALVDEGTRMLAAIPRQARIIALDGEGEKVSSESLAQQLVRWRQDGRDLAFLIGGPDGLAPACFAAKHQSISLGAMTLPHALVRIVLAEQLFRAHCILANHPYHRAVKAHSFVNS
jgi:23S rRNA (pseudouridine1915-N3)-methyltransferase